MKLLTAMCLALTTPLAACSGDDGGGDAGEEELACADDDRADTYTAGMSKIGDNGFEFVLVDAAPTPPDRGDNDWTIQVLDPAAAPMDGLTLEVVPFMPDHGHGTPKVPAITPADSGTYQASPVNLWMPGLWEVTVSATDDTGLLDTTVFSFCLDG